MRTLKLGTVIVIIAGAVAALTVNFHAKLVPLANASQGCSVKTLHGTYGGVASGLTLPGAPPVPASTPQPLTAFQPLNALEVITFDGSGNFQSTITASVGGTPGGSFPDSGTYVVGPNCTGSLATASGFTFAFAVFHNGSEVRYVETDGTGVAAFMQTRMQDE